MTATTVSWKPSTARRPSATVFPDTYVAGDLEMVARVIAARSALQATRQTFFVMAGGWDHHDELINNQAAMLPEISQAVGAFYNALVELGVQNQVTLFTASDFARTLTSNGRGSDHAWGGNHFVVGGAVNGRRVFGQYPVLYEDNPLDVGRGQPDPDHERGRVLRGTRALARRQPLRPRDRPPEHRAFLQPDLAGHAPGIPAGMKKALVIVLALAAAAWRIARPRPPALPAVPLAPAPVTPATPPGSFPDASRIQPVAAQQIMGQAWRAAISMSP